MMKTKLTVAAGALDQENPGDIGEGLAMVYLFGTTPPSGKDELVRTMGGAGGAPAGGPAGCATAVPRQVSNMAADSPPARKLDDMIYSRFTGSMVMD